MYERLQHCRVTDDCVHVMRAARTHLRCWSSSFTQCVRLSSPTPLSAKQIRHRLEHGDQPSQRAVVERHEDLHVRSPSTNTTQRVTRGNRAVSHSHVATIATQTQVSAVCWTQTTTDLGKRVLHVGVEDGHGELQHTVRVFAGHRAAPDAAGDHVLLKLLQNVLHVYRYRSTRRATTLVNA